MLNNADSAFFLIFMNFHDINLEIEGVSCFGQHLLIGHFFIVVTQNIISKEKNTYVFV